MRPYKMSNTPSSSLSFLFRSALSVAVLSAGVCVTPLSALAQTGSGGKSGTIEKCERNLGTMAVAEPQTQMLAKLTEYKLGSPATMLRMIAQESGCFMVVERGVAMQNIQQERALAAGGLLQQDSNMGGGQLQAADFVLTPSVQFSDNTGGMGAGVGSLFGRMGGVLGGLGGLAGGVTFKEAETTLLLADVRSGIQVASAEGQASKMDFSLGGWGWGGMGWAAAGGYSKTPEGKLIAASLLDNYNRIVQQVRNRPSLVQTSSASSRVNAQASTQATPLSPSGTAAVMQAPPMMPMNNSGMLAQAAGTYVGRFAGQLAGTFSLQLLQDGRLHGVVKPDNENQFLLKGQINNTNGDFTLGGSTSTDSAMVTGRLDLTQYTMQGQWFLTKPTGGAPHTSGGFVGRR